MNPLTLGIIMVVVLAVLIVLKFPIGFAFLIVGFWGFIALRGFDSGFSLLASKVFSGTAHYLFTVVPLFILMGELAYASGIGEGLFRAGRAWLGHIRGGLAMATTMANAASTMASAVGSAGIPRTLGKEPALTPTRMGALWSLAASTTRASLSRPPRLPGLIRIAWAPCSTAATASRESK